MKKLVLTAVVVGFAAVAAQAQGTGDGGVTREAYRLFYEGKHKATAQQAQAAQTADTLTRAVAKQAEKERVRRAREQQAEKANKPTGHFRHVPATGVMRDYATEGRLQEGDQTVTKPEAKPTAQKTARPEKKKQETVSWLARAFGFAKYEGETDEEWQARLTAMALK